MPDIEQPEQPIETPLAPYRGRVLNGILLAAGWNAAAILASLALTAAVVGIFLVAGFGLLQFAWLLPIWTKFRRAGETETAKGVLIVAGITILLSAACWTSFNNTSFR